MDIQGAKWKMRCVIYDCDGVLFDSLEANSRLYNDLCALGGRAPLREEEINYVHTHTVFEAVHFIFRKDEDSEKKALEILKQVDFREYIVYLKMESHLLQTLGTLKENGILRVVNTNRTTSMPHVMDRFNLWPFFDMVVTALDVKNPKPHPESIEKILQTFNLKREEVVFVGDSEVDQQAAQSACIKFVAYKNREIPSDAFIEDHRELFSFISVDMKSH
jgi:HAD superfamily hydrolase (TIGR01509 family)